MPTTSRQKNQGRNEKLLNEKLLSFGGTKALIPVIEEDAAAILARGFLLEPDIINVRTDRQGRPGECHLNSAFLWDANRDQDINIWTGYALSDNIWRPHSWVYHNDTDELFETTPEVRELYYGFPLTEKEAEKFFIEQAL